MTAADLFRGRSDYLPGHHPGLGGPARNGRPWLDDRHPRGIMREVLPGRYYGESDPRGWPRGIRQVTVTVTKADITKGTRRAGGSPLAAAVLRALRLRPGPEVAVRCDGEWMEIRAGDLTEWHDLPEQARAFNRAWFGDGRCRPLEFTFSTAEDWQAASEETAGA